MSRVNEYITATDLSRLVLYTRLKILNLAPERPKNMDTDRARQILADIDSGVPTEGYEADYNRIQRLAKVVNKYEKSKRKRVDDV